MNRKKAKKNFYETYICAKEYFQKMHFTILTII